MTDKNIKRRLAEGIVKLVEELIDYKTEVSIGGFVKITADKCNVFPITLQEYRKKKPTPRKRQRNKIAGDEKTSVQESLQKISGKKRKGREEIDNNETETLKKNPTKKIKYTDNEQIETTEIEDSEQENVTQERVKPKVVKTWDMADIDKSFPCVMCRNRSKELIFESEHKLLMHGKIKHRDVVYKCNTCDQTFQSFFKLHNHHYHVHSKIKNYTCKICDKRFTWALEIRRHSKVHDSVTYTCMKCPWPGKSFISYSKYSYHVKTGHRETRCKKCDAVFRSTVEKRKHFREAHIVQKIKRRKRKMVDITRGKTVKEVKTREVPKPQIGLTELDESVVFVRNVRSKSGKETKVLHEPLKCPHCDMVYWHVASLRNHIQGQHSGNTHTCPVCGISMKHESSLKRHMKSHATAERSFACDQCDKTYKRNCELLRHKKVKHSGAGRGFICSQCGNQFMTASDLKTHENRHAKSGKSVLHRGRYPSRKGEIFCCGECNKIFQKESLLKSHISVTHKNERNFGCGVCGKFYGRSCHLRRHQFVAHGIKAKDTVLIKEDRDVEEKPTLELKQEPITTLTLEGATELVTDNTEFVILSEDPTSQTIVLQSSADGQIIPGFTQEDDSNVVVLHQCPMCEATYPTEDEVRLHLTSEHGAIVLLETDEQVTTEEWVPTE